MESGRTIKQENNMNLKALQQDIPAMKKALIGLLCEKSVQVAQSETFTLASGKKSNFYINCKPVALDPCGMFLIGNLVWEELRKAGVSAVGGLTFGADPVSMAAAFASALTEHPIRAFSIRKNQKDHGIVRWVEGEVLPNDKVAVVDDVATTGGSTIKAIERALESGFDVVKAVILVDREEGGLDAIRKHVPDVSAILGKGELMAAYAERVKTQK